MSLNEDWGTSPRPNTFVVGAPKCGTTALCDYFDQHPLIKMSNPKEPHYFVRDEMPNKTRRFSETAVYRSLFEDAADGTRTFAEGSVWYLYSQSAVKNIHAFDPQAKLIVMLRRPDEMVYSMHNQAVLNYSEDILDFSAAWRTAIAGNKRASWSSYCDEKSKLDYHKIALYSEQLERVYQYFDRSQVYVIFYEDFKSDSRLMFHKVLDFLNVKVIDVDYAVVNESKVVRNRLIGRILRKPPKPVMTAVGISKKILGVKKIGVRDRLVSANSQSKKRPQLSDAIRKDIIQHYADDIRKLEVICGRDLSHWLTI